MAGPEPGDAYWTPQPERPFATQVTASPGRLRIALVLEPPFDAPVDPACREAAAAAAQLLSGLGHDVVESVPPWRDESALAYLTTAAKANGQILAVKDRSLLEPHNRLLAEAAAVTPAGEYARAVVMLQLYARRVLPFWQDVDVVLTPTLAELPSRDGWGPDPVDVEEYVRRDVLASPFTPLINVLGLPAASVPVDWTGEEVPLGVQLIAAPAGEARLLQLAAQIEDARPWAHRRPPIGS